MLSSFKIIIRDKRLKNILIKDNIAFVLGTVLLALAWYFKNFVIEKYQDEIKIYYDNKKGFEKSLIDYKDAIFISDQIHFMPYYEKDRIDRQIYKTGDAVRSKTFILTYLRSLRDGSDSLNEITTNHLEILSRLLYLERVATKNRTVDTLNYLNDSLEKIWDPINESAQVAAMIRISNVNNKAKCLKNISLAFLIIGTVMLNLDKLNKFIKNQLRPKFLGDQLKSEQLCKYEPPRNKYSGKKN